VRVRVVNIITNRHAKADTKGGISTALYLVFYCTVLYCTVLYYTILYYTILYYTPGKFDINNNSTLIRRNIPR
jgi:hypothetical protein